MLPRVTRIDRVAVRIAPLARLPSSRGARGTGFRPARCLGGVAGRAKRLEVRKWGERFSAVPDRLNMIHDRCEDEQADSFAVLAERLF